MTTLFEALYDLAIELRVSQEYKNLTRHHNRNEMAVIEQIKQAVTTLRMEGEEAGDTSWNIVRVFCRNFVNRSQPAVRPEAVKELLDTVSRSYSTCDARIAALSNEVQSLTGARPEELTAAIDKFTSAEKHVSLNNMTYLEWVTQRCRYWLPRNALDIDAAELLEDISKLSDKSSDVRIRGMGLAITANFFADLGLAAFAKPDLHVASIIGAATFNSEEAAVFRAVVEMARVDSNDATLAAERFLWLQQSGGLMPRYIDRIVYLIGSDNFELNGVRNKRKAPERRLLMKRKLVSAGIMNSRYWRDSDE